VTDVLDAPPASSLDIQYEDVTLPPDFDEPASSDVPPDGDVCVVCGTPLVYAGRGRRPRYCDEHKPGRSGTRSETTRGTTGRTSKDVEAACAALHGLYEMVYYPLAAVSAPAAQVWSRAVDDLDKRNRLILSGDPKLARSIVASAEKGGVTALVISHAIAVVPVAVVAARDIQARREAAGA